jgi:aspartyl-tRNA(Asn)/glutamyl-tRNA(Gln) amidotransferase subunit A
MTELHWRSLAELATLLADRELSAAEVLDATFARIEATEPRVHAYARVMEKSARTDAARADKALAGGTQGPLCGVPIGVKDLCYTAGFPTSAGSRVLEGFLPDYDATVVRNLRAAGAVIVGKTVTHEFAYGQDVPPTRNAWDRRCYPGGSSAGSGVAVAVGSAYGAIGTDTGGSIRVPASVNGVVGLKPTFGRISRRGVVPMSPTMDTVGPLARTVRDVALLLGAVAGAEPGDPTAVDEPVPDYVSGLSERLDGLRIGVERKHFLYDGVIPEVRTAVEAAIAKLAELGATLVEVEMQDAEYAVRAGMAVLVADTSEWHQSLLRRHGDRYVRETRVMLELGELVPAAAYAKAQRVRTVVQQGMRRTFEEHRLDAIAAPTTPVTTMPVEDLSVDLTGSGQTALAAFTHQLMIANVVGTPSLSVPAGYTATDLPIGMQLMGRPFGEEALLRIGHAYEQASPWRDRHPDLTTPLPAAG